MGDPPKLGGGGCFTTLNHLLSTLPLPPLIWMGEKQGGGGQILLTLWGGVPEILLPPEFGGAATKGYFFNTPPKFGEGGNLSVLLCCWGGPPKIGGSPFNRGGPPKSGPPPFVQ